MTLRDLYLVMAEGFAVLFLFAFAIGFFRERRRVAHVKRLMTTFDRELERRGLLHRG